MYISSIPPKFGIIIPLYKNHFQQSKFNLGQSNSFHYPFLSTINFIQKMPPTTTTTSSQSLLLLPILAILIGLSQAYPAFFMQAIPRGGGRHLQLSHHHANSPIHLAAPHKRAFDRLDVSPFDFDAMTKRFNDDELSALPFDDNMYTVSLQVPQRKRAFDRLEDSGFFGLHKRAFDRLDNSFMMLKRNAE